MTNKYNAHSRIAYRLIEYVRHNQGRQSRLKTGSVRGFEARNFRVFSDFEAWYLRLKNRQCTFGALRHNELREEGVKNYVTFLRTIPMWLLSCATYVSTIPSMYQSVCMYKVATEPQF